jgi:imidazole glycerol-phosphate synthase subunit HisH
MKVGIIDYEGGNLASVARAVEHLGFQPTVTRDPSVLRSSDKVIFPGVGAAGAAMEALEKAGLLECVRRQLTEEEVPCLGICIGIQMLFEHSEEDDQNTLGILPGRVKRFDSGLGIKVPHIGWNRVSFSDQLPDHLLEGIEKEDHFYFVNSYYVVPDDDDISMGKTTYGGHTFTSMVKARNWTATQFHLEKSGPAGLKLLKNFLEG